MARLIAELDASKAKRGINDLKKEFSGLEDAASKAFSNAQKMLAGLATFSGFVAADFYTTNTQLERMTVLLDGVTGSASKGAEAFKFITEFATQAPYSVDALSDSFVRLSVSGIEDVEGKVVDLTNALSYFGGTSEDLKYTSVAIQQMAAKGVISMEELRQQFAERVPSALQDMASELGMTYQEMVDKISRGNLSSTEGLEALFKALEKYGGANTRMMNTMGGAVSVLRTQWALLLKDIGDSGSWDDLVDSVKMLSNELLNLRSDPQFEKDIQGISDAISELVTTMVDNKSSIISFFELIVNRAEFAIDAVDALVKGVLILQAELLAATSSNFDFSDIASGGDWKVLADKMNEAMRLDSLDDIEEKVSNARKEMQGLVNDSQEVQRKLLTLNMYSPEDSDGGTALRNKYIEQLDDIELKLITQRNILSEVDEAATQSANNRIAEQDAIALKGIAPAYTPESFISLIQDHDMIVNLDNIFNNNTKIWSDYTDKEKQAHYDGIAEQEKAMQKRDKKIEDEASKLVNYYSEIAIDLEDPWDLDPLIEDMSQASLMAVEFDESVKGLANSLDKDINAAGLEGINRYMYDINESARNWLDTNKESSLTFEDVKNKLVAVDEASGKMTKNLISWGKESDSIMNGFNAGLLEAIDNTMTLGELGSELTGKFISGVKGALSASFRGEFDEVKNIFKDTLKDMEKSVTDWAADQVIEMGIDFMFGGSDGLSNELKDMLGVGDSNPMSSATFSGGSLNVAVTNQDIGSGAFGSYGGFQGSDIAGSITKEELAWSIAEGVTPWAADLGKVDTSYAFDPTVSSGWSDQSADFANDFSDALGNVSQVTIAAIDKDLDNLMDSKNDLYGFRDDTLMDSARGTWETAKPYVGAATSAYGIYSGIQQGGVGGAFQTAGGVASLAGNEAIQELIPALADMSSTISTLGSGIGVAGGLYGAYQGVKEGDYVQAASGAYQAYQGATTLMPEIGTAISEGFSSVGSYFATEAAAETGSLIVAETATGAGTTAGSGVSTFMAGGGGAMIGIAIKMGMDIYASETEDKFKYESSYGGFEVAEKGQDRGSALVRSIDTIMEDLAASVEAGASAVNYVPDEMVQRANQHLEVLWTEFGEGMAGMALAVEPSLNSFDQYVQATTNAHLSTQELSWMMEKATEASFGNIEAVQSLEYYMVTLGQSTVEASVSAAGMISAMGEASTGMTAAGQTYYATLAQMAAGTSDFDGTVRELQATMGITDEVTRDLSGTLEGAAGKLDSYGNVITDVGGDASEASTYMEQFGSAVRGMSDEAIAAANAFNGIVMQAPQGYSERGAQGNYNKDGAVYSYHASGGVMNRPTVFHVGGEAGDEAITPLHAGPKTLEIMHNDIKDIANKPVQVTVVGDEAGLRRFIRVESDDLVTSKLQRGQGTERVEF